MEFMLEVSLNGKKVPALWDTGAYRTLLERKYLKAKEMLPGANGTGLIASGDDMDYLIAWDKAEINGKLAMVEVGVREKQCDGCLLGNDWIAHGLVPDGYMARATSAVLTRAQAAHKTQEKTGTALTRARL